MTPDASRRMGITAFAGCSGRCARLPLHVAGQRRSVLNVFDVAELAANGVAPGERARSVICANHHTMDAACEREETERNFLQNNFHKSIDKMYIIAYHHPHRREKGVGMMKQILMCMCCMMCMCRMNDAAMSTMR